MATRGFWGLVFGLVLLAQPAFADIIPNGDFATGDFTDWTVSQNNVSGGTSSASVQFIDSAYRAVLTGNAGPGSSIHHSSGDANIQNFFTLSEPAVLAFDASYSYSTTSAEGAALGMSVAINVNGPPILGPPFFMSALPIGLTITGPASASIPTTRFTVDLPAGSFYILADVIANSTTPGVSTATLTVSNFRIIPEPATVVLAAMGLAGLLLFARRTKRGRAVLIR